MTMSQCEYQVRPVTQPTKVRHSSGVPKAAMRTECWNDPWSDGYSSTGWSSVAVSLSKEFECSVLYAFDKKGHMCLYWWEGLASF